ncbi:tRNA pseudouridine synthase A isoform X2 [Tripterygium wilfordii]|uniref:tRNA pseudouridine synthase A isoform X2 n=1 Tax=Tripterygium wilfordii TaxID=458696 RepID=UPI0018F828F6|nr:tRNA pseudouridine synthase A isoform X2 [Tripterygium wilfordii]
MTENPKDSLETHSETPTRPSKIQKIEEFSIEDEEDQSQQQGPEESGTAANPMSQNPRIQRYFVAIEYIGSRFSGSQQQLNCRTVVGVLQEAFQKFIGQPVSIFCSSRTDAGVHALSNVCHVDVERISKRKPGEVLPPHEPAVVRKAVNHFLQKNEGDIMVVDVRYVPSDFHARYKAKERTYFYRLLSGPDSLSTFEKDRAWHVPEELNLLAMQASSPIRTLDELHVSEVPPTPYFPSTLEREQERQQNSLSREDSLACSTVSETDLRISSVSNSCAVGLSTGGTNVGFGVRRKHRCYVVTARSRSFLYHQVRLLVGVLKSVGTGDLTVSDVERILNAKTVTTASPMAPACGLYLGQVKYDLP